MRATEPSPGRRYLVPLVVVALVVVGVPLGKMATPAAPVAPVEAPSATPVAALSSSWFCAGATAGAGTAAAGTLLLDNFGRAPLPGVVQLVSAAGERERTTVSVPAGGTISLREQLPGGPWAGAVVTFYGGMAAVTQLVATKQGIASQPCASAVSPRWYFPDGAALRNATDEISLLNPYSADAIADLSFTTELGQEEPAAFEGIVVPARGLAVVDLGSHLRRRQHIAVSVTTRKGQIVAFQTELVARPPRGAPLVGTKGALNPAEPVPGAYLLLGSPRASASWWWPEGADTSGLSETYAVYDPGGSPAHLTLSLVPEGTGSASAGATFQFALAPYGTAYVETNGQPWALPDVPYAVRLSSEGGVPVVAARSVAVSSPLSERGLGVLLGQASPAGRWLVPATSEHVRAQVAPQLPRPIVAGPRHGAVTTGPRRAMAGLRIWGPGSPIEGSATAPVPSLGLGTGPPAGPGGASPTAQVWLEVSDPGPRAAMLEVQVLVGGRLVPLSGRVGLLVAAGQRTGLELPAGVAGKALVVSGSQPFLLEEDSYGALSGTGVNLSPGVLVSSAPAG